MKNTTKLVRLDDETVALLDAVIEAWAVEDATKGYPRPSYAQAVRLAFRGVEMAERCMPTLVPALRLLKEQDAALSARISSRRKDRP